MTPPPDRSAGLLATAAWLPAGAAVAAAVYGAQRDSVLAVALAVQLVPVAAQGWLVGRFQRHRGRPADGAEPSRPEELVRGQHLALGAIALGVLVFVGVQAAHLAGRTVPAAPDVTLGAVGLGAAFLWLVLARAFGAVPAADLPEAPALAHAFRESQWAALVAAGAAFLAPFLPDLAVWAGGLLLGWTVLVGLEVIARAVLAHALPAGPGPPVAPAGLLVREALFARGNPLASLVRTTEDRFGVNLRASWAAAFVRRATLPMVGLLALLLWGLSAVSVVETGHLGVRESFGRVDRTPLEPGLHAKPPWPFGRVRQVRVKTVHSLPIGYSEEAPTAPDARRRADRAPLRASAKADAAEPRSLLWTKAHAAEEYALVLGSGAEVVAVNALVYYKVDEDPDRFFDYVLAAQNPVDGLTAAAYRALMEETRSATLDQVLARDREAFTRQLADRVRRYARDGRLGLEVVEVALVNLHPPIEAAPDYLDVINARLDARRREIEARGEADAALSRARADGQGLVSTARADAARRVAGAGAEAARFLQFGRAAAAPGSFRQRLYIEALEQALADQRVYLLDKSLAGPGGELLLDTRGYANPARGPGPELPGPLPANPK